MSTVLISMLGGAGQDAPRSDARMDRYRLPGGERIVETSILGVELGRALGARRLVFVGTTASAFDGLVDLLSEEQKTAPVAEGQIDHGEEGGHEGGSEADSSTENDEGAPAEATDQGEMEEGAKAPEAPAAVTEEGSAAAPAEIPSAPSEGAPAEEPKAPQVLKKVHEPDFRSLADRLTAQTQSGRPDRGALTALATRLKAALHLDDVRCVLTSDPTAQRSALAALRTLVEIPEVGETAHIDVSFGPRAFPVAGFLAMHYLREFRPDVHAGSVFAAQPEAKDIHGVTPIVSLDGQFEIMKWMGAFSSLLEGQAPTRLHHAFTQDRRLGKLVGPYVRYQRGIRFGALHEVIEGSKMLEETRRKLGRLPYAHPYRLFDGVLHHTLKPFLADTRLSEKQFLLARQALDNGHLPLAALHLREALLSYCLEAYGRDATRPWMDVPQSGGAQEVRPRDIAGFILSTEAAASRAGELATVWPLLATARNRYVNTSPTMVHAGQLRDEDHEIHRIFDMAWNIASRNELQSLPEALPFDDATKQAVDLRSVRPREGGPMERGGRNRGRGRGRPERGGGGGEGRPERGGGGGGGEGRPEGGPPANRPPRQDRDGRPPRSGPRDDRGGRGPRGEGGANGRRDRDTRGPRPPREGGGPNRGEGRPNPSGPVETPRPEATEALPRVHRADGGLGNLGLALAQAGLVQPKRNERPPAERRAEMPQQSVPPAPPPAHEPPPVPPAPPAFDVAGPA